MSALHVAIDLGAGSGRVIAGQVTPDGVHLEEAYRFSHSLQEQDGRLRWDYAAIKPGTNPLLRSVAIAGRRISGYWTNRDG